MPLNYFRTIDNKTKELFLSGKVYDLKGMEVAKWRSTNCDVILSDTIIYYYWEGDIKVSKPIKREGFGIIKFDTKNFNEGEGEFTEIWLKNKKEEKKKTIVRKASEKEVQIMKQRIKLKKISLIEEVLNE